MSRAKPPMDISALIPIYVTSPNKESDLYISSKPEQVSLTKVRSRVGESLPNSISVLPLSSCDIIVGMIALADCLGP